MNVLSAIANYFRPLGQSAREHREENLSVAEANKLAAEKLLQAEREYWEAYYERAWAREDFKSVLKAQEELDRLDVLARAS